MNRKSQIEIVNTLAIFIFIIMATRSLVNFYYSFGKETSLRNAVLALTYQSEYLKSLLDEERRYSLDEAMFAVGRFGGMVCTESSDKLSLSSAFDLCEAADSNFCKIDTNGNYVTLGRLNKKFEKPQGFLFDKNAFYWVKDSDTNIPSASSLACGIEFFLNNYFNKASDTFITFVKEQADVNALFSIPNIIDYSTARLDYYDTKKVIASFIPASDSKIVTFYTTESVNPYYQFIKNYIGGVNDVFNGTYSLIVLNDSRFVNLYATTEFFKLHNESKVLAENNFVDYFKSLDVPYFVTSPIKESHFTEFSCMTDSNCIQLCTDSNYEAGYCQNNKCVCKKESIYKWDESIRKFFFCDSNRKCGDTNLCESIADDSTYLTCVVKDFKNYQKEVIINAMANELVDYRGIYLKIIPYYMSLNIDSNTECDPYITGYAVKKGGDTNNPAFTAMPLHLLYGIKTQSEVALSCEEV